VSDPTGPTRSQVASAASTWDRLAGSYARQERWETAAIEALLGFARPAAQDVLLDVGTGTGLVLRTLAGRSPAERPALAIGLDRSPGMLAQVGNLPAGWELVHGSATAIPVADASVDVITCSYVLHLLDPPTRAAALREMDRVARPGGRVVVSTPWSPRAPVRAGFDGLAAVAPARFGGLRTLDTSGDLRAAGLRPERGRFTRRGYPTLVVAATSAA
jgi:ubiquinone/menaquinone biosynthesis C-methylase UbiE